MPPDQSCHYHRHQILLPAPSELDGVSLPAPPALDPHPSAPQLCVQALSVRNGDGRYEKPNEDRVLADIGRGIFVLADGATRVPIGGEYPDPSPSAEASAIFCRMAHAALLTAPPELPLRERLMSAAIAANEGIAALNERLFRQGDFMNVDFWQRDFASAVGVIAVTESGKLHYVFIGDCFICRVRGDELDRLTPSQSTGIEEYRRQHSYSDPSERARIKRDIRNNTLSPLAYGAMTGQLKALPFVEYGEAKLEPGARFVIASDGLDALIDLDPRAFGAGTAAEVVQAMRSIEVARGLGARPIFGLKSDDKSLILIDVYPPPVLARHQVSGLPAR